MQVSRNIVNGPKRNNYFLVGIRAIVCLKNHLTTFCKPSIHYACLRLCSVTVDFIRNNCLYFVC